MANKETGTEGVDTELKLFGTVPFVWAKVRGRKVVFHIITVAEEMAIISRVNNPQPLAIEKQVRLAYAIRSVNDKPVDMALDEKIEWVKKWPISLLDEATDAYERACHESSTIIPLDSSDDHAHAGEE